MSKYFRLFLFLQFFFTQVRSEIIILFRKPILNINDHCLNKDGELKIVEALHQYYSVNLYNDILL